MLDSCKCELAGPLLHAYLLIFQSQQQDLLHERKLGLLAPLSTLTNISWVKRNLVSVLTALVGGFWTAGIAGGTSLGNRGCHATRFSVFIINSSTSSTAASSSGES